MIEKGAILNTLTTEPTVLLVMNGAMSVADIESDRDRGCTYVRCRRRRPWQCDEQEGEKGRTMAVKIRFSGFNNAKSRQCCFIVVRLILLWLFWRREGFEVFAE